VPLIKLFSVCSDKKGKIILQNPKIVLEQFGAFLQKYTKDFRKEKEKENEKKDKRLRGPKLARG
jgi:hypothetical protein